MDNTIKRKPYDNIRVYAPNGNFMFFCSWRRAIWYLRRGLAEKIGKRRFRLKFWPEGEGDKNYVARRNVCCVCGSREDLSKHHIVPYMYWKHFPVEVKSRNSGNIALVCRSCHDEYEIEANDLKNDIAREYGIKNPADLIFLMNDDEINSLAETWRTHFNDFLRRKSSE